MSRITASIRRNEGAPRAGRAFVAAVLADHEAAAEAAALIASELLSNAVLHEPEPDTPVELSLDINEDLARLSVAVGTDEGFERRAINAGVGGGFGLSIVAALADRWGITHGKRPVVWADLRLT